METEPFARAGEIIPDETGKPAFQLLADVAPHDFMKAEQVIDLRTGHHPTSGSDVPNFVRDWITSKLGFK